MFLVTEPDGTQRRYTTRELIGTVRCVLCGNLFRWRDLRSVGLRPIQFHATVVHEGCCADYEHERARDRDPDEGFG